MAQVRYVDDLLSISLCLCAGCIQQWAVHQHPGVPFGLEGCSDDGPLGWLDLQVHSQRHPPHITVGKPELAWATGAQALPIKYRIRPALGKRHHDPQDLRSYIRARLARWTQARISRAEARRATRYEFMVMSRAGYPWRLTCEAWVGSSADHAFGPDVADLVQAIESAGGATHCGGAPVAR